MKIKADFFFCSLNKGVWMNFERNRLFCLLGPNGAGKTTLINCLTGITQVSNGDGKFYLFKKKNLNHIFSFGLGSIMGRIIPDSDLELG